MRRVMGFVVGIALASVVTAQAQDKPTTYLMGTYYRCAQGDVDRADAIYKEHFAPIMKAAQAAGNIASSGWAKHAEGGEWRRLMYMSGTDIGKLVDAREAQVKTLAAPEHAKAFEEFARICPSHDDYIWRAKSSSGPLDAAARTRAPFGMSTYYVCSSSEGEADAIVDAAFAPVLNQRVKDGSIAAWNWIEHMFGGQYRRALVVDGKDEKSLLQNWASLMDAIEKASPDLSRRFSAICDSHTDYIWDLSGS